MFIPSTFNSEQDAAKVRKMMNIRKKYNKKLRRNNSILTSYCLVKNTRIRDFFYTATTILRRYKDEVGKSMKIALS